MEEKERKILVNRIVEYAECHPIKSIIYSIIFAVGLIVLSAIIMQLIVNSDIESGASNDGWISFYGGVIGGVLGGIGTIIAVLITTIQAKNHQKDNSIITKRIQEDNINETRKVLEITRTQLKISNLNEKIKDLREKLKIVEECKNILLDIRINKITLNNDSKLISFDDALEYAKLISKYHGIYMGYAGSIGEDEARRYDSSILNKSNYFVSKVNEYINYYMEHTLYLEGDDYIKMDIIIKQLNIQIQEIRLELGQFSSKLIIWINTNVDKKYSIMNNI